MKAFSSICVALVLLFHTVIAFCPMRLDTMRCGDAMPSSAAPMDATQSNTHVPAQAAAVCYCADVRLVAFAPAVSHGSEPSGQLRLSAAPASHDSLPRLIDPPPRRSFS